MLHPHLGSLVFPIDDESGYGVLCRIATLMGFHNLKSIRRHLRPDLPPDMPAPLANKDLSALAVWASGTLGLSPIETANKFSNLPLYRPFSSIEPRLGIQEAFYSSDDPKVPRWWRPLGVESKQLRSCVRCRLEQYERYGFTTWLRSHNVAKVSACSLHGTRLTDDTDQRKLLPPVRPMKAVRSYKADQAPEEEIFHAKYVRAILNSNLPWIPSSAQGWIIEKCLFEMHQDEKDALLSDIHSSSLSLSAFLLFPPAILDINTTLYTIKRLFKDFHAFKQLHLLAASNFTNNVSSIEAVSPGKPLLLQNVG